MSQIEKPPPPPPLAAGGAGAAETLVERLVLLFEFVGSAVALLTVGVETCWPATAAMAFTVIVALPAADKLLSVHVARLMTVEHAPLVEVTVPGVNPAAN